MGNRTEVDNLVNIVADQLRIKKVMHIDDIEKYILSLDSINKVEFYKRFQALPFVKKEEGMFAFAEADRRFDVQQEEEIFASTLKPEYVNTENNFIQIGDHFYRGLYTTGFPNEVRNNWLSKLAGEKGNMDFSIFINPTSIAESQIYLNDELKRVNIDLYSYNMKGIPAPTLDEKKRQLEQSIRDLSAGAYKHFKVSMYLTSKGTDIEKVETLAKNIKSSLSGEVIESEFADQYQEKLFKSTLPFGTNYLKGKENIIPGPALAASFPFSFSWLDIDEEDGILLAWNQMGLPIARSLWKLPAYSGSFSGPTGTGKSYAAKALIRLENLINGTKIIIIDPAASARPEYKRMCEKMNGNYISFSTESKNIPNILGLYGDNYDDAIAAVASLLSVLLGGKEGTVSDAQKPILFGSLVDTYEKAGVTKSPKTWSNVPTLDVLFATLKEKTKGRLSEDTRRSYDALINRLSLYVGRGLYSFINQKSTSLNIDNSFTVFEFKKIPEDLKPVLTGIVMNYVHYKAAENLDKKLVVLEEAHMWLSNVILSDFIGRLIVTLRKSNTGLILIFQGVSQLQRCEQGITVLGNLSFSYIMGCKKPEMELTAKAFGLNDIEQEIVLNSNKGTGILIWDKKHFMIQIKVDNETHRIITTNPEEIKKIEMEESKFKNIDAEIIEQFHEDLGFKPKAIEEGAMFLANEIARGKISAEIINHYHSPADELIKKHLKQFKGKFDKLEKISSKEDEKLDMLADKLLSEHKGKKPKHNKNRKIIREKSKNAKKKNKGRRKAR